MAHQSGIPVTAQLDETFSNARAADSVRMVRIEIQDDTLVDTGSMNVSGDFESDFKNITSLLEGKKPCYIACRLDSTNMHGHEWMLCSYVPDGSPVKQRMLYASTRELLKRQLGSNFFSDDLHGSSPDDLSWDAYVSHKTRTVDAPLTEAEKTANVENLMEIDHGHTREYVHSVQFPVSKLAIDALSKLGGKFNLVQLQVDPDQETVELLGTSSATVDELPSIISADDPSFNFFRFDHECNGVDVSSTVFIYSCPDSCKVKLRMLYSTVKAPATQAAEEAGVKIEKKFEVSEPSEITRDLLYNDLHPVVNQKVQRFTKPMRAGRGRPRMTKK